MCPRGVPISLAQMYEMANGPRKIFSWSADGRSFWVTHLSVFCRDVLPTYFKHSNYASFTRLISLYGMCGVHSAARDRTTVASPSRNRLIARTGRPRTGHQHDARDGRTCHCRHALRRCCPLIPDAGFKRSTQYVDEARGGVEVFKHPAFLRGRFDILNRITRKKLPNPPYVHRPDYAVCHHPISTRTASAGIAH